MRICLLLLITVLTTSCMSKTEEKMAKQIETPTNDAKLKHVVLFKFKAETSTTTIKTIETAFAQLPSKIEIINDFEWGLNNSPEGLNKGFTHCFILTFNDENDRAVYLPHPAHKDFVKLLEPYLDDVLVLDYWAK